MLPVNYFWVPSIIRYLERHGKPTKTICDIFEEIKNGNRKLSENQVSKILSLTKASLGKESAIIESSKYSSLSDYAYVGMLLCSCRSILDLLIDKNFIRQYILQSVDVEVLPKPGGACVRYSLPSYVSSEYLQILAAFFFFANRIAVENHGTSSITRVFVNEYAYEVGSELKPVQVKGRFPYKNECKVYFSRSRENRYYDPGLKSIFEKVKMISERDVSYALVSGVIDQVRLVVSEQIENPELSHKWVARKLGMCERKLQKKLKEEGTSYRDIVDGVRMRLASHYLKEEQYSVTQTGLMLGYTATSNFIRAYKRWCGNTPRAI